MTEKRDYRDYLRDIVEHALKTERFLAGRHFRGIP